MQQRGCFGSQNLLRFVDLSPAEGAKLFNLVERQRGEELEEALHVGVLGVAPVLPVVIGRELRFV